MHVVIAGCGRVGSGLARDLVTQGFVEESRVSLSAFASNKPVRTYHPDPEERRRLSRRVDLVILGDTPERRPFDLLIDKVYQARTGPPQDLRPLLADELARLKTLCEKMARSQNDKARQLGQENRLKAARKVLPAVQGNEGLTELGDVVPAIRAKVEMVDRIFEGRDLMVLMVSFCPAGGERAGAV